MENRLIITCDDAGMASGINTSIVNAKRQGIVTTASVMANFKYAESACAEFQKAGIICGAHFNLTDGQPLTPVNPGSGLVTAAGKFQGWASFFRRAIAPSMEFMKAAENELIAQVECLLNVGMQVTHLTSHMHFQLLPWLQCMMEAIGKQYRIVWLRNHRLQRTVIPFNFLLRQSAVSSPNPTTPYSLDYLIDLYSWMRIAPAEKLAKLVMTLHGNVELVVHPSIEVDPTYPHDLPNKPHERHQQLKYLERFMEIFLNSQTSFRLIDPANDSG
jgi:predicted glycoside hydrolase/deacetylase ChbG (UPF0249 family)